MLDKFLCWPWTGRKRESVDPSALVTDLKRRGLLEDTLILFGGEFGRTPMGQGDGRDHHIRGFSYLMGGAGIPGGGFPGNPGEIPGARCVCARARSGRRSCRAGGQATTPPPPGGKAIRTRSEKTADGTHARIHANE